MHNNSPGRSCAVLHLEMMICSLCSGHDYRVCSLQYLKISVKTVLQQANRIYQTIQASSRSQARRFVANAHMANSTSEFFSGIMRKQPINSHKLEASIKYRKLMEEHEQPTEELGGIGATLHQICQVVATCFSTSGIESNNISTLSMSTNPAAHSVPRAAAGSLPLPNLGPRQAQKLYRKRSWPKSPVFALPVAFLLLCWTHQQRSKSYHLSGCLQHDPATACRVPQQLQQAVVEEEELCALRNTLPLLAIERASAQR